MKPVPISVICQNCRMERPRNAVVRIRNAAGGYYLCRPCADKRKPPTPPDAA